MPTFTRMEVPCFANSVRAQLKPDASQILTRTSIPAIIVKTPKPESLPSETDMKNCYKTAVLHIRNVEECNYLSTYTGIFLSGTTGTRKIGFLIRKFHLCIVPEHRLTQPEPHEVFRLSILFHLTVFYFTKFYCKLHTCVICTPECTPEFP